jgi:hypothetical protein
MTGVYSKARLREWRVRQRHAAITTRSPAESTSSAAPPERRPRPAKRPRYTQAVLDVGQRGVDWTKCARCGMQYVGGAPADVRRHKRSCKRLADEAAHGPPAMNFTTWTRGGAAPVATLPGGGRVFDVADLAAGNERRAARVDEHLRGVLGVDRGEAGDIAGQSVVLLHVDGATSWITAYVAVQLVGGGRRARIDGDGRASLVPDSRPVVARMAGVLRVWVAREGRRRALASKLLDLARHRLLPGTVLPKSAVAFTTPTQSGAAFAVGYSTVPAAALDADGERDRRVIVVYGRENVAA